MSQVEELALGLTDTYLDLNALTNTTRRRVVSMLRLLELDLVKQLGEIDLDASESMRRRRIEKLIRDVRLTINKRYRQAEARAGVGLREIAEFTNREIANQINSVFGVSIVTPGLTLPEVRALVQRDVVLGEPAADWWAGQSEGTRRRFARAMRLGILQGETNDQLVRRIRGRSTGSTIRIELPNGTTRRIREYAGGILDVSRHQADALVRTSAQSVSNEAILDTYEQNDDLIKGYQALTTLDLRTSEICMARTGAAWYLDGTPMPDSTRDEPVPGPPPWHFNCRTVLVAVTYSWDELMDRAEGRRRRLLNSVPDSRRASFDGSIKTSRVHSFDDWLRIRGDAFARKKLGPGLFDLWKSNKISLSQLIDQAGNPLPLYQLN